MKQLSKTLVTTLFCFFIVSCVTPGEIKPQIDHIESKILQYGIGDKDEQYYFPWKDENGKEYAIGYQKFIPAYEIPLKLGNKFGITYVVNGDPIGKETKITIKINHPFMRGRTTTDFEKIIKLGRPRCFYFEFENESELLEGIFEFQIIHENKVIMAKSFQTVKLK